VDIAPELTPRSYREAVESGAPGSPLPQLRDEPPAYTAEDRDYLIRTIAFEAPDESDEGKAAVAHVILNRTKTGRWGGSIKDVVTHPGQFEPWMTRRKEIEGLSADDPRYREAAQIADALLSGQTRDPTAGATHFLNPEIVRQRRGGSLPAWARGEGQPIGKHTFYRPKEGALANQADAGDVPSGRLMRLDCDKAGMAWEANASVCVANLEEAQPHLGPGPAARVDRSPQTLTELDCDGASLASNDNANLCGEKTEGLAIEVASIETSFAGSTELIDIDEPDGPGQCLRASQDRFWAQGGHFCALADIVVKTSYRGENATPIRAIRSTCRPDGLTARSGRGLQFSAAPRGRFEGQSSE
jgi:hypothetical protein